MEVKVNHKSLESRDEDKVKWELIYGLFLINYLWFYG